MMASEKEKREAEDCATKLYIYLQLKPYPLPTPNPILQLKRLEYPEDMCCVQLGSKFYFFGGKYVEFDHPYVDQDVYRKYQHVKRFTYPLDLYIFDPTTKKLINGTPMNTGKAYPGLCDRSQDLRAWKHFRNARPIRLKVTVQKKNPQTIYQE